MIKTISTFFERITLIKYSSSLLIFVPIIVTCIRVFQEELFFRFEAATPYLVHNYLIGYVFLMLMIAGALHLGTGLDIKRTTGVAAMGLLFAGLPAFIDLGLGNINDRIYMYFPTFQWYFSHPGQMIGETITLLGAVLVSIIFAFWATQSIIRTIFTGFLIYGVLQIYSYGWLKICELLINEKHLELVEGMSLSGILLVFFCYSLYNYKTIGPSIMRFNHSLPWGFIVLVGSQLIREAWTVSIIKGIIMALAFQLIVVANDYFDRKQDQSHGGSGRPVTQGDMVFVSFLMVLIAWWILIFHDRAFFLILLFFSVFTAYHIPSLRFKRVFFLNYTIEGIGAMSCFTFGIMRFYLNGPSGPIVAHSFPTQSKALLFSFLAFGGFTLGCMFKDYKDIEQDRYDNVSTIYTWFMKKGRSLNSVHHLVCLLNPFIYITPVIFLYFENGPFYLCVILFVLAFLPSITLYSIKNKKMAVESTLWLTNSYLLILAIAVSSIPNSIY